MSDAADVDLDSVLAELRAQIAERTVMIHRLLRENCPAGKRKHRYVEHAGSMPWCPHCGYTALGNLTPFPATVLGRTTEERP